MALSFKFVELRALKIQHLYGVRIATNCMKLFVELNIIVGLNLAHLLKSAAVFICVGIISSLPFFSLKLPFSSTICNAA